MIDYTQVSDLDLHISRTVLGTWAIGGWMWGGTEDNKPLKTIIKALKMGVSTIDTAPAYGFGKSEELVGEAVKEFGNREVIQISTKWGLQWDENENLSRNSTRDRLKQEVEDSLERLQTDYIDIYQIHWPDPHTDFEETAAAMNELFDEGVIRAIGVSNFSPEQMDAFRQAAPIHVCQPPYNLFERGIEKDIVPYCKKNNITLMTYGALSRGLLSGKMSKDRDFNEGIYARMMTRNFRVKPSKIIYVPLIDWMNMARKIMKNRSCIWPFAGFWIRASMRPFGAPANLRRLPLKKCLAGSFPIVQFKKLKKLLSKKLKIRLAPRLWPRRSEYKDV